MEQTRQNAEEFVWTSIPSVEELGCRRMAAMETFLDDYEAGKVEGRYVNGSLPVLPFADDAFDLALCSHLLFLYTMQLGEAFHRSAVRELRRVAREVRIFPLLALGGERSPYVETVAALARAAGTKRSSKLFRTSFGGAGTNDEGSSDEGSREVLECLTTSG